MLYSDVSRSLFWTSALVALAQGLPAVDDVTLIDQRTAVSGKVSPPHARRGHE
jgi:hypothetical protein